MVSDEWAVILQFRAEVAPASEPAVARTSKSASCELAKLHHWRSHYHKLRKRGASVNRRMTMSLGQATMWRRRSLWSGSVVIAIVVLGSPLIAQAPAEFNAEIIVIDQTGAKVPRAQVSAINREGGVWSFSGANSQGEALTHLTAGTYTLKVQALGFKPLTEDGVVVNSAIRKTVTLEIDDTSCDPCTPFDTIEIPVEHPEVAVQIPLMPLQSLERPRSRSLRHRH